MTEQRSPFLEAAEAPSPRRIQRVKGWFFRRKGRQRADADVQAVPGPHTFEPIEDGSGSFGRWIVDDAGLPAYEYEMDQYRDPRAIYPNTENLDRRDHWHQVGNRRITALASNDGTVQVYLADRGGLFLNRFEAHKQAGWLVLLMRLMLRLVRWVAGLIYPEGREAKITAFRAQGEVPAQGGEMPPRAMPTPEAVAAVLGPDAEAPRPARQSVSVSREAHAYAGGFGYIDDGVQTWATAYRYRPDAAQTRRVFGMSYCLAETNYREIAVTRRVYAPHGADAVVIAEVELHNTGSTARSLRHYEYWDVNLHQLTVEWVRSGLFAAASDAERRELNRTFRHAAAQQAQVVYVQFTATGDNVPPPDEASQMDWYPPAVFLANLSDDADAVYIDKGRFFGGGDARQPEAVTGRLAGDSISALPGMMPYCLVFRHDVELAPGARHTLRFAYGAAYDAAVDLTFLDAYRDHGLDDTRAAWKPELLYFWTGQDAVLHREMAWHTYNMLSSTVRNAFHNVYHVPQGSAYLYLHGADGAPRDYALFALPLTYIDPALARDMLRLIMRLTDGATGQIAYALVGHGVRSFGMNVHGKPSDLDLFFLLALAEYLAATGDRAFLDEEVPFYPYERPPTLVAGQTVRHHVLAAVKHIFEVIGIGDNGLVKVGSGDWSDSIVLETALRDGIGPAGVTYDNSKQHGESVPNTLMALFVLPLISELIADADLNALISAERLAGLREAASRQWHAAGWYNRAVLRDARNAEVVLDWFGLEAQVWALICGQAGHDGHEAVLVEKVEQSLDRPSPIGAGLRERDAVWPAVSQLLTWAYARTGRQALAWRSLNRNTFAMHSYYYPDVWFNTWSGPDGINGLSAELPGGTWFSPMTPMTDFPVMNVNQDAMALLGTLRVCGIEPAGDGLLITPRVPRDTFVLDVPLLRLEAGATFVRGEYRAQTDGAIRLRITAPEYGTQVRLRDEDLATVEWSEGQVVLPLEFVAGDVIPFEVVWRN